MPRGKIVTRLFLPLNCWAITLTTGRILKEEVKPLVDVSDIFSFFLLGEGRRVGSSRREGVGNRFFIEIPGGGSRTERGRGAGGCLQRIGGGGG